MLNNINSIKTLIDFKNMIKVFKNNIYNLDSITKYNITGVNFNSKLDEVIEQIDSIIFLSINHS
jgi:hypothetical protein